MVYFGFYYIQKRFCIRLEGKKVLLNHSPDFSSLTFIVILLHFWKLVGDQEMQSGEGRPAGGPRVHRAITLSRVILHQDCGCIHLTTSSGPFTDQEQRILQWAT